MSLVFGFFQMLGRACVPWGDPLPLCPGGGGAGRAAASPVQDSLQGREPLSKEPLLLPYLIPINFLVSVSLCVLWHSI